MKAADMCPETLRDLADRLTARIDYAEEVLKAIAEDREHNDIERARMRTAWRLSRDVWRRDRRYLRSLATRAERGREKRRASGSRAET